MADLAAQRTLYGRGSAQGQVVTVQIHKPELLQEEPPTWGCLVTFTGGSGLLPASRQARGQDGVQALVHALQSVGMVLDATGAHWDMLADGPDESWAPGVFDDGFPRPVMSVSGFPSAARERIYALVEAEKLEAVKGMRRSGKTSTLHD